MPLEPLKPLNKQIFSGFSGTREPSVALVALAAPETLVALYGSSDNPTAFQIVNAKYHQDLEPVYKDQEANGFFEVFKEKKSKEDKDIITIIEKRQAEDGKANLPDIPE